jgi:hypothetical protein
VSKRALLARRFQTVLLLLRVCLVGCMDSANVLGTLLLMPALPHGRCRGLVRKANARHGECMVAAVPFQGCVLLHLHRCHFPSSCNTTASSLATA